MRIIDDEPHIWIMEHNQDSGNFSVSPEELQVLKKYPFAKLYKSGGDGTPFKTIDTSKIDDRNCRKITTKYKKEVVLVCHIGLE